MKITGKMLVALIGLMPLACKPTSDKVPKANDQAAPRVEAQVQNASPTDDRATAQQKLSAKMSELDAKMAELKASAQKAGEKAKAEWEARRPQLEAQRDDAAKKLDELKAST